jgi:hypothetical protein
MATHNDPDKELRCIDCKNVVDDKWPNLGMLSYL